MTCAYLVSRRYDLTWFLGPGLVALVWGLVLGLATAGPAPVRTGLWFVVVVLVDVAHVYATAYRTYLDPGARTRFGRRLVLVPAACLGAGFVLYLASPLWFWRVLAYVAIFHFIQQHVGFALLYARKGGEPAANRRAIRAAIWAGTLAPVVYWHATLPRTIAWFVDGDFFVGLPRWAGTLALGVQVVVLAAYAAHRAGRYLRRAANPMTDAVVLLAAANWNLGIVWFDDDRIFTVTNVLLHGIPYMALVFVAGGRRWIGRFAPAAGRTVVGAAFAFYGALATAAILEEGLWDVLVHHDRPGLFGPGWLVTDPPLLALLAAALSVPQTTHYLLDRWIWRIGDENPDLAGDLGLRGHLPPR